jgi:hypothetical protein
MQLQAETTEMTTRLELVNRVENRRAVEDLVLRAQTESHAWVRQLGREDGAAIADRIIARVLEQPGQSARVGDAAARYLKTLLDAYRRRGIDDDVVDIWRVECATELYHRFTEFRDGRSVYLH